MKYVCRRKLLSQKKNARNEIGQCADDNEEAAVQQLRCKPAWYSVTVQTLQKRNIVVLELKER